MNIEERVNRTPDISDHVAKVCTVNEQGQTIIIPDTLGSISLYVHQALLSFLKVSIVVSIEFIAFKA